MTISVSLPISISIVVLTYNQISALKLILAALVEQNYDRSKYTFEVIIADDGSTIATRDFITALRSTFVLPYVLRHVWHEDQGFRISMIRNKAVAVARGDYVIFIDGDCIPRSSFVQQHALLAEKGWLVAGNRILLRKEFTAWLYQQVSHSLLLLPSLSSPLPLLSSSPELFSSDFISSISSYSSHSSHEPRTCYPLSLHRWRTYDWFKAAMRGDCNRFLPAITLRPLPHWLHCLNMLRKLQPHNWYGAKTCNLAVWKQDFMAVGGFDESYVGWGYEDADLVIRLMKNNVRRKNGHFAAPVIHLWHEEAKRDNAAQNLARLKAMEAQQ